MAELEIVTPVEPDPPGTHYCSICDAKGPWTASWYWYGSYKDLDDGKPVLKTCSEACRVVARARGLVPPTASIFDDEADTVPRRGRRG